MSLALQDVKLLSVRQAAALTGLSKQQLWYALRRGRISPKYAQLVDGRWVIREDFKILRSGMNKDPLLANLPEELISDEPVKDWSADLPQTVHKGNVESLQNANVVRLVGYEREVEGMSVWEIYDLTRVHPATQKRIREGEKVKAKVALRLARGLGIPAERLLHA
jgi:hypothetical protein